MTLCLSPKSLCLCPECPSPSWGRWPCWDGREENQTGLSPCQAWEVRIAAFHALRYDSFLCTSSCHERSFCHTGFLRKQTRSNHYIFQLCDQILLHKPPDNLVRCKTEKDHGWKDIILTQKFIRCYHLAKWSCSELQEHGQCVVTGFNISFNHAFLSLSLSVILVILSTSISILGCRSSLFISTNIHLSKSLMYLL